MTGAHQPRDHLGHTTLHGIQYWNLDGPSGYIVEVVWFLHPACSGSSLSRHPDAAVSLDATGPAAALSSSTSNSSFFSVSNSSFSLRQGSLLLHMIGIGLVLLGWL